MFYKYKLDSLEYKFEIFIIFISVTCFEYWNLNSKYYRWWFWFCSFTASLRGDSGDCEGKSRVARILDLYLCLSSTSSVHPTILFLEYLIGCRPQPSLRLLYTCLITRSRNRDQWSDSVSWIRENITTDVCLTLIRLDITDDWTYAQERCTLISCR